MGCGSGIVSVFAASNGACCLAVDKNPMAVKSAAQNALQNNFSDRIEAIESDLFDRIESSKKFDFIFFNPPYYKGTPQKQIELAFKAGENFEVIENFISGSRNYLNAHGIIYMVLSSDISLDIIEKIFNENGFSFDIVKKSKKFFETFYITKSFLIK